MPALNLTITQFGSGKFVISGDFNAVAALHGAGYYLLTGDIVGTLTLRGDGTARLTGTSSNATYSGAVALSFATNGDGQVSTSGTIGSSTVSATLSLVGKGQATSSGTITPGSTLFLRDSFNRPDGAIGSPDFGPAYSGAELTPEGYTLATILSNKLHGTASFPSIIAAPGSNQSIQVKYVGTGILLLILREKPDAVLGDLFGYWINLHNGGFTLDEYHNNASYDYINRATSATVPVSGDIIYAEVRGSNITVKVNGVTVMTYASALWPERTECGLVLYANTDIDDLEINTLTNQSAQTLLFGDDFSGAALDASLWSTKYPWGWRTWYLDPNQIGYFQDDDVTVSGGIATLGARKRDVTGVAQDQTTPQTFHYTSGMISTAGSAIDTSVKFSFRYGRVEAKIKFPFGSGFHPALWMFPASDALSPELDIAEFFGTNSSTYRANVGYRSPNDPVYFPDVTHLPSFDTNSYSGAALAGAYHVYGINWEPGSLTFDLDGVVVATYTTAARIPTCYMYPIISFELENGGSAGAIDDAALPASILVDYVKVWGTHADSVLVAPTAATISPNTASNGGTQAVTITGTGFVSGARVKVGTTSCTGVTVVNSTTITATVPASITPGTYDVKVLNFDGKVATISNGFTVTSAGVNITDNFTGGTIGTTVVGKTTTTGGKTWQKVDISTGTDFFYATGGHVKHSANGDSFLFVDSGIADFTMQTTLRVKGGFQGFFFRWQDATHNFIVYTNGATGPLFLDRDNGATPIDRSSVVVPVVGDVLKVVCLGTNIKVYINATLIYNVTNANYTANTKHGIYMSDPNEEMSDFSITS